METDFLRCDQCQTILTREVVASPELIPCPGCATMLTARVFPAFFRAPFQADNVRQEAVSSDEEASCFFHPRKKAVVDCAQCGRFLCGLCDLDIDGRHLCPTCVESSRGKGGTTDRVLRRDHIRHDFIALNLAFVPLLMSFVTIVTAPVALYYVIRYWKSPTEALIPRGHSRQILAAIMAVIQLVVWGGIIFYFWLGAGRGQSQLFHSIR